MLWFNVVENKSHQWGVMAFHWYFSNALPKVLLSAFPLACVGFVTERRVRKPFLVALLFVGLFSMLPHKEVRFVIYSVPLLNLAAAVVVAYAFKTDTKRDENYGHQKRMIWRMHI